MVQSDQMQLLGAWFAAAHAAAVDSIAIVCTSVGSLHIGSIIMVPCFDQVHANQSTLLVMYGHEIAVSNRQCSSYGAGKRILGQTFLGSNSSTSNKQIQKSQSVRFCEIMLLQLASLASSSIV